MYVHVRGERHFTPEQIEELKREIRKTEYEKAREPLLNELQQAHKEAFILREKLVKMQNAFRTIITSIKDDYIDIVVDYTIPEARFFTRKRDFKNADYSTIKMVKVPIKQNLIRDISRICNEIEGDE